MSISIEQIESEYAQKKYNGDTSQFSDLDKKMIKSIFNLRSNYKEEYEKRKCSVFLKDKPTISILEKPKENIKKDVKKETKTETEIILCEALKMNGEKCTSKAKSGCFVNGKPVCGRHNKS